MFMEYEKNVNKNTKEDYFSLSQIAELIGDIEHCAGMLVNAARKAKVNIESLKNNKREELVI